MIYKCFKPINTLRITLLIALVSSILLPITSLLAEDLVIDTSGTPGLNGRPGRDGVSCGDDGSPAGHSTAGTDAGQIQIRLSRGMADTVIVSGTHQRQFSLGTAGQIILRARGGAGGAGGHGGDGARGCSGSDGSDATRYSNGTDGSDGHPGGDGASGTSGSAGGRGGRVTITVREADMNLLYLVAIPEVAGGPGGAAGRNGEGGPGGSGGSGGSSYSWSETVSRTCTGTRTVEGSNGTSTTVTYEYDCSTTETHSNPGGSSGSSGPSGNSATTPLYAGADGASGSYDYIVEFDNGSVGRYQSPFQWKVDRFELIGQQGNSFLEPGETFGLAHLVLRNVGGMPTPTRSTTVVHLESASGSQDRSAFTEQAAVTVAESVAAGDTITLTTPLRGQISPLALAANLAQREQADASHFGGPSRSIQLTTSLDLTGIRRSISTGHFTRSVQLKFPVAMARILGRRSIGQGEDYLFRWSLLNSGTAPLGREAPAHRGVRVRSSFTFSGGVAPQTVTLERRGAQNGETFQNLDALQGTLIAQQGSHPSESSLMGARLAFSNDAPLAQQGILTLNLELEDLNHPGQWNRVDQTRFVVRVGQAFVQHPGSRVLFVTNPQTTRAELDAWAELFQSMGLIHDTWDLGIMGALDTDRRPHLLTRYSGGTIVILNDLMTQPGEEAVPADAFFRLGPSRFTESLRQNNIGLYIFDRTGSYGALAGQLTGASRTAQSVNLVAHKIPSEARFRSRQEITGLENKISLAMTFSLEQKLLELQRHFRTNTTASLQAFRAHLAAIIADLAVEQAVAREAGRSAATDFPLLSRVVTHGILPPLSAQGTLQTRSPYYFEILHGAARLWFFSESQVNLARRLRPFQSDVAATTTTQNFLRDLFARTFAARDSWSPSREENQAFQLIQSFIQGNRAALLQQTQVLADRIRSQDQTRFFTFPRSWNGDYFRQAAYSLILGPVYERTFSSQLDLFDRVMHQERPALPSMN